MKTHHQWINWAAIDETKVPVNPKTGNKINPHNPVNWLTYEEAAARGPVGFVLTDNDPFFFIDIDHCLMPDGATWSPLAVTLCQMFAGCYIEVSPSGTGLHIHGITPQPAPDHGCKNTGLALELYTTGRFATFTGNGCGDPNTCPPGMFETFVEQFAPPAADSGPDDEWTNGPVDGYQGPADDNRLIKRMLGSRSATAMFAGKVGLKDLWDGNAEAIGATYPHPTNPFDYSSADAALCSHLAFWTGKDCDRMDRLFRRSALVRGKWTERADYSRRTILGAVRQCERVYKPAGATDPESVPELRTGEQFLPIDQQIKLFTGCIYVREHHRLWVPDGSLLKPDQVKAHFGGYLFMTDATGEKTTRNAWEAFTESQGYHFPRANDICFRPEEPPGVIIEEEGRTYVNTYVPIEVPRMKGDPKPFLDHIGLMVPDKRDREILLCYMAAVVQYPGVKFQWCPLIQGVEGNGKTLVVNCLSRAIGRRYTHLPNAQDISNKFNSWLANRILIGVEEIYTKDRQEVIEVLKPMITNRRIEIQAKGGNQYTYDNRANFVLTTNHRDAIRKTLNDRRFCVFFTAQQTAADIPGGNYFPELYAWLRVGGYAIVTDYLMDYQIADQFNPATICHRAPTTTSTMAAVAASMGGFEQELLEAIAEDRPGFAGGWVSSLALGRLIGNRWRVTHHKRREILEELGYTYHPYLRDGRVNNPVIIEGGKPRLFIRTDSLLGQLTAPADIQRRYMRDQNYGEYGIDIKENKM